MQSQHQLHIFYGPTEWTTINGGLTAAPFTDEVQAWANSVSLEDLHNLHDNVLFPLWNHDDEEWLAAAPAVLRYTLGVCPVRLADTPDQITLSAAEEKECISTLLCRISTSKLNGLAL